MQWKPDRQMPTNPHTYLRLSPPLGTRSFVTSVQRHQPKTRWPHTWNKCHLRESWQKAPIQLHTAVSSTASQGVCVKVADFMMENTYTPIMLSSFLTSFWNNIISRYGRKSPDPALAEKSGKQECIPYLHIQSLPKALELILVGRSDHRAAPGNNDEAQVLGPSSDRYLPRHLTKPTNHGIRPGRCW